MKKVLYEILFVLFCAVVLLLSIRGLPGNPTPDSLNTDAWKEQGPFELSPERGRFALTYALSENHATNFSLPLAKFTTPDLGFKDGKFVALVPPGVSYLITP